MSVRVGSAEGSGRGIRIRNVTIIPKEKGVKTGEPLHVYVNIELAAPATEEAVLDVAIAVNSKDNIVKTAQTYILPGDSRTSMGFSLVFKQPGTYTIYGGAKIEGGTSYVWSQPMSVKVSSDLQELLLKFGGVAAVIGGIAYMATRKKG
jgi:hypothetical protein